MTNNTPLSIDTEGLETFTVGQEKHLQLQASGGTPPYKWSTPQSSLPPETTLSTGGLISGLPRIAAASITVPITVTDSSQPRASNTRAFEVDVNAAPLEQQKAAKAGHK